MEKKIIDNKLEHGYTSNKRFRRRVQNKPIKVYGIGYVHREVRKILPTKVDGQRFV